MGKCDPRNTEFLAEETLNKQEMSDRERMVKVWSLKPHFLGVIPSSVPYFLCVYGQTT